MAIVLHEQYFRLKGAENWFFTQGDLPPKSRENSYGILTSYLDGHKRNLIKIKDQIMAKKETKDKGYVFKGYANISIPEKLESNVASFSANIEEIYMQMNSALIKGYTIKAYFDDKSECFKATLTCMNMDDVNGGYSMSAFADDWMTAIAVALFKHIHIADGDWTAYQQSTVKRFG